MNDTTTIALSGTRDQVAKIKGYIALLNHSSDKPVNDVTAEFHYNKAMLAAHGNKLIAALQDSGEALVVWKKVRRVKQ